VNKWLGEHWAQIITAIVAVYGAVLSTLNLLNVRKEKKRQLLVKMSYGWLTLPRDLSDTKFLIEVANPGYRPVTIQPPYSRFRHELLEGKSCSSWIEEAAVKRSLKEKGYSGKVKLRAEVDDQTGKKYRAKKALKYDLSR
jgi:hypothetical protein